MIDWHDPSRASEKIVNVYADAATPKKFGINYDSQVWGKAAYCSFTIAGEQRNAVLTAKHEVQSIRAARRVLSLSSALLELENYVQSIITFALLEIAKLL